MKIVFAATPAPGHLNPLLAIARLARARGDEALVVTGRALAPHVEAAGLRFIPLAPGADFDYRTLDVTDPERAALPPGPQQLLYDFERLFVDTMPAQTATLLAVIADEAPDLVVVDSLFLGSAPLFLGSAPRPAIVTCGVTILPLDRADGAPMGLGLPPARDAAERGRYRAIRAGVDAAFTGPLQAHADATLAAMGLPPLDAPLMHACVLNCDAYLAGTVPEFEFDMGPQLAHVSFVGALPPPPVTGDLPGWWGDLDGGRRVVLVTQGTVANADLGRLIGPTLTALADRDDLLVLATTGGRPVTDLGLSVPANARVAPFLPFAPLLPRVDALVTNGGYGTVQLALRAGVLIVVAGLTEDKAEVAARVAASGVGIDLHTDDPTPEAIRASVDAVLTQPSYRERAGALAAAFAAHDTPSEILRVLDRVAGSRRSPSDGLVAGWGRP